MASPVLQGVARLHPISPAKVKSGESFFVVILMKKVFSRTRESEITYEILKFSIF